MTSSPLPSLEDLRSAVERDADRLVEDLFAGFEAGDRVKSSAAGEAESSAPAPLALREPDALLVLPESPVLERWEPGPDRKRSGERWFFLGTVLLLLGSLAWFWRSSLQVAPVALPISPEERTAEKAAEKRDRKRQEFITYLQKSLATIERDERHARQLAAAKAERDRRERAEREAAAAALPAPTTLALAPPPPVEVPLVPPPPVIIAQSIAPPVPAPVESPAVPTPPSPPQPVAATAPVESAPSAPVLEVLGSLEIDNLALALIEIDGKTERVAVGEAVPGTDWSVMTIAPRQVVLRDRAGRERTVPVGSRF